MQMGKIDWNVWKPRLAYGAFALLCFVLALRWTFPSQAVKERLILEAGVRGWQIDVDDVSAGGLVGVTARGVKLASDTGLSVPIDEVTASLRPLALLAGRRSVAFDVRIFDGRVRGTADLAGDALQHVVADVDGVDLGRALPLRKASGLDLLGRVRGSLDVTLPASVSEKPSGRIDLRVKDAGIAGGQLPVPGMTGGLPLPRMGFGEVNAAVQIADGKATFQRLEARGGDAELSTQGLYFLVQPRMEFAPIFGTAKVKVGDAFWSKSGTQGFKGLADVALAQAKGPDGAWSFNVTGSVGHPRVVPAAQR
ncbi:MAG TPA: type II secretion system protein GspN [Anaeromyxobacteraceae bacterium]|nr:type II secretion system protein GspN [Anaeromyxobacteraceae bacterium]